MIEKILEFMRTASELALVNQQSIDVQAMNYKEDKVGSVVTKTDIMISQRFKSFVEDNFSDLDFVIIDEESLSDLGEDKFRKVSDAQYQFVIDPIDGTHTYALKMPDYAISVGIMKDCKPYLGAVALPYLGAILYYDGKDVHWIQNLNQSDEIDEIIKPCELSNLSLIFDNQWFVKMNDKLNFKTDTVVSFYSCIVHFFYMITNRGKGYYFGSYIWDMAGSWPLLKAMGFEFMNYNSGEKLEKFTTENFDDRFLIKDLHIVSKQEDFGYLKNIADLRTKKAL